MKLKFRFAAVAINNILVFLSVAIPRRIPVSSWPRTYRRLAELHEQQIRQDLTDLTMSGRIKRRIDDNGEFRYYPPDSE